MPKKRSPPLVLTALIAACSAVWATPASGQQEASLEIDEVQLVHFVRVHVAITEAQEKHQGQLARMHDTQGKDRLRAEFALQLDQIFVDQDMPQAEFERITAVISVDSDARARFEKILRDLDPTTRDTVAAPKRQNSERVRIGTGS